MNDDKNQSLRTKLIASEQSGMSSRTPEQIRKAAKARLMDTEPAK